MTQVIRIPVVDNSAPLDTRIANECDVRLAAGYRLAGSFALLDQIILIFQKA